MTASASPLSTALASTIGGGDREEVLDALRAFALFGILVSHVPDFTGYNFLPAAQQALLDPLGIDPAVTTGLMLFIREKFLSLFALLFGIGFTVQLDSAARRGGSFQVRFARRLAALFIIGAVHAALWYGDILKDYAVLGLALLAAARWPVRRIAITTLLLLLSRLAWPSLIYAIAGATGHTASGPAPAQAFADGVTGLAYGFGTFFRANLGLVKLKALQMIYEGRFLTILTMFFIGAWAGKLKLYRDLGRHRGLLIGLLATCGVIGAGAEWALVPVRHATNAFPPTRDWVIVQSLMAVAAPALSIAYASTFALAWLALKGGLFRHLAPVGRMALTSYVSQTVICMLAFTGLGLGRNLGETGCVATAALIFMVQCLLAPIWLRHFRFGPLEWLWRCATYAEWIDIRRKTGAGAGA